jgi:hypothetical protein
LQLRWKRKKILNISTNVLQPFLTNFLVDAQPTEALVVEYYTSTLHDSISMFVRELEKIHLQKILKRPKM